MSLTPRYMLFSLLLVIAALSCQKPNMLATVESVPYLGLPATINHLHMIDIKRLRGTQVFQDGLEQLRRDNKGFSDVLEGMRQQVGIDPIQEFDTVTIALRGKPIPNQPLSNMIVLVQGQFAEGKTEKEREEAMSAKLDKLRQWLGDEFLIQPPPFESSRHQASNVSIHKMTARSQYNERIQYQIMVAFPTNRLMILSFSPELMNDTLDVIAAVKGVQGLNNSPDWVEKLKTARISAMVWGYGDFKLEPEAVSSIPDGQALLKVQNYFYGIDSDSEFRGEVGFVCDSIESATALSATIDKGRKMLHDQIAAMAGDMPEVAKIPERLLITTELKTSRVVLRLTSADINKLNQEIEKKSQGQAPAATPAQQ